MTVVLVLAFLHAPAQAAPPAEPNLCWFYATAVDYFVQNAAAPQLVLRLQLGGRDLHPVDSEWRRRVAALVDAETWARFEATATDPSSVACEDDEVTRGVTTLTDDNRLPPSAAGIEPSHLLYLRLFGHAVAEDHQRAVLRYSAVAWGAELADDGTVVADRFDKSCEGALVISRYDGPWIIVEDELIGCAMQ